MVGGDDNEQGGRTYYQIREALINKEKKMKK
jgi:hypothetical protein